VYSVECSRRTGSRHEDFIIASARIFRSRARRELAGVGADRERQERRYREGEKDETARAGWWRHDDDLCAAGGNTAEAIPARFHNEGKRIYSAVAFLLFREERDSGPTENGRRNFDNIQRQVRRLRRGGGGDDSARVLIECVGK